jgi:beta-carotene 3-hydroxylase
MSAWLINSILTIVAFAGMECIAWLSHRYIMHGFGWFLHKDHHQKETTGFFERNDFFFLIFAIPGIFCLFAGLQSGLNFVFWTGLGITLYGAAYFFVHDIFIHQRFKIFRNTDSFYLRAIRKAHKMHHKHLDKHHGESFGMLWVPIKYFKEALKSNPK